MSWMTSEINKQGSRNSSAVLSDIRQTRKPSGQTKTSGQGADLTNVENDLERSQEADGVILMGQQPVQ